MYYASKKEFNRSVKVGTIDNNFGLILTRAFIREDKKGIQKIQKVTGRKSRNTKKGLNIQIGFINKYGQNKAIFMNVLKNEDGSIQGIEGTVMKIIEDRVPKCRNKECQKESKNNMQLAEKVGTFWVPTSSSNIAVMAKLLATHISHLL